MNLYKVRVYSIGYGDNNGNDTLIGKAIVRKTIFGIEEIKTGWPIRMVPGETLYQHHTNSYFRPEAYKEFGYDLAVMKEDLKEENKVKDYEVKKYFDRFEASKIRKVFIEMKVIQKEDKKEKIKK